MLELLTPFISLHSIVQVISPVFAQISQVAVTSEGLTLSPLSSVCFANAPYCRTQWSMQCK